MTGLDAAVQQETDLHVAKRTAVLLMPMYVMTLKQLIPYVNLGSMC